MPVRQAFAESRNAVAIWIAQQVGVDAVLAAAHDLGVADAARPYPTTALGASEVTLLEFANAYRALASGLRVHPYAVRLVSGARGKELYPGDDVGLPLAGDERALEQVRELLRGIGAVARRHRSRPRHAGVRDPVMGKTGTTRRLPGCALRRIDLRARRDHRRGPESGSMTSRRSGEGRRARGPRCPSSGRSWRASTRTASSARSRSSPARWRAASTSISPCRSGSKRRGPSPRRSRLQRDSAPRPRLLVASTVCREGSPVAPHRLRQTAGTQRSGAASSWHGTWSHLPMLARIRSRREPEEAICSGRSSWFLRCCGSWGWSARTRWVGPSTFCWCGGGRAGVQPAQRSQSVQLARAKGWGAASRSLEPLLGGGSPPRSGGLVLVQAVVERLQVIFRTSAAFFLSPSTARASPGSGGARSRRWGRSHPPTRFAAGTAR